MVSLMIKMRFQKVFKTRIFVLQSLRSADSLASALTITCLLSVCVLVSPSCLPTLALVHAQSLSRDRLLATLWTVARVTCITGGFCTCWAMGKPSVHPLSSLNHAWLQVNGFFFEFALLCLVNEFGCLLKACHSLQLSPVWAVSTSWWRLPFLCLVISK